MGRPRDECRGGEEKQHHTNAAGGVMSADEMSDLNEMMRWAFVDGAERKYRNGNKEALIDAIAACLILRKEVPLWARNALVAAWQERDTLRSWDEVFGRPSPNGKSIGALKRRQKLAPKVIARVKELRAQGHPIEQELFDRVGREMKPHIGGDTAKAYYYDKQNRMAAKILKIRQAMIDEIGADAGPEARVAWLKRHDMSAASIVFSALLPDKHRIVISKKTRITFRKTS
jgi:hypothetical protein